MLELFFDSSEIGQFELVSQGETVNKHLHKNILRRLRDSILCKCPKHWRCKKWLLLHHNAPAHQSMLAQKEFTRQQIVVFPHPPYSLDLVPCCLFLFPRLKQRLRGCIFQLAREFVTTTREAVRDIPASAYQRCFQQLYQHWQAS